MDYLAVVRAMLDDFGNDPTTNLGPLLTALGTGIATSTVLAETADEQSGILETLFQCIREDAMERFVSYDRFLQGDKTFALPAPDGMQ